MSSDPSKITERALVTGASAGIGEALARRLAQRGTDLVLVARREQRLDTIGHELAREHGVAVEIIVADLTSIEELAVVEKRVHDPESPVDLLVNNAGFGSYGRFGSLDVDRQDAMIDLNVRAVMRLSHTAVNAMSIRGRGGIINVSSTAAFQPGPFGATYGATKAFVQSFTEALHEELRGTGLRVMSLAPGFTDTEFQREAHVDPSGMPALARMTPGEVAEGALRAFERGSVTYVPGLLNKLGAYGSMVSPSVASRKLAGAIQKGWLSE